MKDKLEYLWLIPASYLVLLIGINLLIIDEDEPIEIDQSSQETGCEAKNPPPVTTMNKFLDDYLFTYESLDIDGRQPDPCFHNKFYVTKIIPEESEAVVHAEAGAGRL